MNEQIKKVSDSATEQCYIVMPKDANGNGRLFGGRLLEWMDLAAAITARRHAGREVTTAAIDSISFKAPAHVGDTVVIGARVTYVGRTSMEIRTEAYVESLDGERSLINTAYFILIALDKNEKPCPVPRIIPETEQERADYNAAAERKQQRKKPT